MTTGRPTVLEGDADPGPDRERAASRREARTAPAHTMDLEATPGARRHSAIDRASAGDRTTGPVGRAATVTRSATTSRALGRTIGPTNATARRTRGTATARRVRSTATARHVRTTATGRHVRTTGTVRPGPTTAVRAIPASRPARVGRGSTAGRGSAVVLRDPDRPARGSSLPSRSSRSRRTRSSSPGGGRSRRHSSPDATPTAYSSPRNAGTPWSSSCCTPRGCASRSRRSKGGR